MKFPIKDDLGCLVLFIVNYSIHISYPDGQSVSSFLKVEPFAVLFWALGIVLARRPGGELVQLSPKVRCPPSFSNLGILL